MLISLQEWEVQISFRLMLGTLFGGLPSHHDSMAVWASPMGSSLHFYFGCRSRRSIFHSVRRACSSSIPGILGNSHYSLLYVAATRDDWWNHFSSNHIPGCTSTRPLAQIWREPRGPSGLPHPIQLKYLLFNF